ncbi:MAG: MFS transporter [Sphaerochaeta sp.]|uniref:MFS transporter n=1 Tax=Sphaerochaeta sp. TaxID=1972642 RepID=UPI00297894E7|nr:MFS transporter [Sphaerochaeta sp.]
MVRSGKRWVVLLAALCMQTILGGVYAWSTLSVWIREEMGISSAQAGLVFGMTIMVFTIVMVFSGRILPQFGPRKTASIGALFFFLGYLLAAYSHASFALLLLGISVLSGIGIGFSYVVPLSVCLKWFPTQKGLVTGLSVGGFGGGAILLSAIIEEAYLSSLSLSSFLLWYSIISFVLLFLCAQLLAVPEASSSVQERPPRSAYRNSVMILSSMGMFAGTFAGLLVVGNLSPLVQEWGLSEVQAVLAVMLFSVGNASARIVWGYIFDRIGAVSIPLSLLLFSLATLMLLASGPNIPLILVLVALLGFSFGANFVLYAAVIAHAYPLHFFSSLYPLCFLFYGIAGLLGPGIGGWLRDATGSYMTSLVLCLLIVFFSALLLFIKRRRLQP